MKEFAKRIPGVRRIYNLFTKVLPNALSQFAYRREISVMNKLVPFTPAYGGYYKERFALTFLVISQSLEYLSEFAKLNRSSPAVTELSKMTMSPAEINRCRDLGEIFQAKGSDKSSNHNYHLAYGRIISNADEVTKVLEIGIGTNNTSVLSNMGADGRPGASLRAWREWFPNAKIFGADIDRSRLFEEDRIKTFFVDQTDRSTVTNLFEQVGSDFDLIIDDGLHAINANLCVAIVALEKIKVGGWIIIEDVQETAIPIWEIVASTLPANYSTHLYKANMSALVAIQRTA